MVARASACRDISFDNNNLISMPQDTAINTISIEGPKVVGNLVSNTISNSIIGLSDVAINSASITGPSIIVESSINNIISTSITGLSNPNINKAEIKGKSYSTTVLKTQENKISKPEDEGIALSSYQGKNVTRIYSDHREALENVKTAEDFSKFVDDLLVDTNNWWDKIKLTTITIPTISDTIKDTTINNNKLSHDSAFVYNRAGGSAQFINAALASLKTEALGTTSTFSITGLDNTPAISSSSLSSSNSYLSDLIQNSEDAFNNMFDVNITFKGSEAYHISKCRITNFTAPKREVLTEDIPFMNIKVKKILASSSIEQQQTFNIRIDENYLIWTRLKERMCINEKGDFNIYEYTNASNDEKEATITVTAYKFESSAGPTKTRQWIFYRCRVTNIADFTYNYGSSQGVAGNITFIYSQFDEKDSNFS